jgi:phosphoglucosamine mutase
VLHALRVDGRPLQELTAELELYPQAMVNVRIKSRFDFLQDQRVREAVASAEARLDGRGRVLLRPSGTEPLIRVMVEGRDRPQVQSLARSIAAAIEEAAPH